METSALLAGLLLPWVAGMAALVAAPRRVHPLTLPGELAWLGGTGYFVGAFLVTVWMRVCSAIRVDFGWHSIGAPMLLATLALGYYGWRGNGTALRTALRTGIRTAVGSNTASFAARLAWRALLLWIVVRFALLALEISWRPLYPWDAWTQWATKARVWYALGGIVPFADAATWLTNGSSLYFDAAPDNPPTLPLLQVWTCVALGRWDDSWMNWPWWQFAVALALAVYGGLRSLGLGEIEALVGSFLVSTLPLANVHVALAGYPDLPLAAYYAVATLAFLRWCESRSIREAGLALLLALACTQIAGVGVAWAVTLLAGVVVVMFPRRGLRGVALAVGAALLVLAVLAQATLPIAGLALHLDVGGSLQDVAQSAFLLGSWNLLWYVALAVPLLAWRELTAPSLAPLTAIVASALLLLATLIAFPSLAVAIGDHVTPNRLLLQFAPLAIVYVALAYRDFARRFASAPRDEPPSEATAGAASPR